MAKHRTVYEVVTKPGGIDGKDRTDKGEVVFATFDLAQAEATLNPWKDIRVCLIDPEQTRKTALAKLSPLEKLVLGLQQ